MRPRSRADSSSADNPTASGELLARAKAGDSRALSMLYRRQGNALRRWAHGRLPRWSRQLADTADLVQDVLIRTLRHVAKFEDRGRGALQAYLRQAVMNRIRDELRRVSRRPSVVDGQEFVELPAPGPSPLESTLDAERERRYKRALATLNPDEQVLVVGRLEMGYGYQQLALITDRTTAEAARVAVRRAVVKLVERMPGA